MSFADAERFDERCKAQIMIVIIAHTSRYICAKCLNVKLFNSHYSTFIK